MSSGTGVSARVVARRRRAFPELGATWFGLAGATVGLLLVLILTFLLVYSWPAIRFNGWSFFTSQMWNIGNLYGGAPEHRAGYSASSGASFGVLVFVVGTLASSALALAIAAPLSILVAIAMVYRIPRRLLLVSSAVLELMAGIPSVVYGLWASLLLVPFLGNVVGPAFGVAGAGYGLLASGLVLAIMILPIMTATTRDVIAQIPYELMEASIALGSTSWQAVIRVIIPAARTGIMAAFVLAAGRALGETMAVLMVCGSAMNVLPQNLLSPINTMAAVIVSQLDSALTDATGMAQQSLGEIALVLFLITLAVNFLARSIMRGADRRGQRERIA